MKTFLRYALLFSLLAVGPVVLSSGGEHVGAVASVSQDSVSTSPRMIADMIIKKGESLLGTPYHYGSGGPKSFDCSGFASYVYKQFGFDLDHSSTGISRQGRKVEGGWSNLQKGDLVIFTARHNSGRIGHVGIFIECDSTGKDFTFIHAAVQGGVRISHISEPYYSSRYVGARRVLPDFTDE